MGPKSTNIMLGMFLGPILLLSVMSSALTVLTAGPPQAILILFLLGLGMFLGAKISVMKKGQFMSFGWGQMTKNAKILYLVGYLVMILCALFVGFNYFLNR